MNNEDIEITFKGNEDTRELIEKIIELRGVKKTFIADNLNMSKSTFNNLLNKKSITLEDIKKICDILDYNVIVTLKKR